MGSEAPVILLNFSHPLTASQLADLGEVVPRQRLRVIEVPTHFDAEQPFVPQAEALLASIELTAEEWQETPFLIIPPALPSIAAVVLAAVHGRHGGFGTLVRIKPSKTSLGTTYDFAELVNLDGVREAARSERYKPPTERHPS